MGADTKIQWCHFTCMADVFEDRPDLVEPRARLAALIRATR